MIINSIYYSGLSQAIMLSVSFLTVAVLVLGLLYKFNIWGQGSSGWLKDPEETGIINFLKNYYHSFKESSSHGGNIFAAIWSVIIDGLLQRREFRRSKFRWLMHMSIFWGFVSLFVLSGVLFVLEFTLPHEAYLSFRGSMVVWLWGDLFGVLLLFGLILAVINRLVNEQTKRNSGFFDWAALILLIIIVLTGFLSEWARSSLLFGIWELDILGFGYNHEIVIVHEAISLAFIAILPFTKYIHAIAAPLTMIINKD